MHIIGIAVSQRKLRCPTRKMNTEMAYLPLVSIHGHLSFSLFPPNWKIAPPPHTAERFRANAKLDLTPSHPAFLLLSPFLVFICQISLSFCVSLQSFPYIIINQPQICFTLCHAGFWSLPSFFISSLKIKLIPVIFYK